MFSFGGSCAKGCHLPARAGLFSPCSRMRATEASDCLTSGFRPRRQLKRPAQFQQRLVNVQAEGVGGDLEEHSTRLAEVHGGEVLPVQDRGDAVASVLEFLAPLLLSSDVEARKVMGWTVPPAVRPREAVGSATTSTNSPGPGPGGQSDAVAGFLRDANAQVLDEHFDGGGRILDGEHRGMLATDGVLGGDRGRVPRVAGVGGGGGDPLQDQTVRWPSVRALSPRLPAGSSSAAWPSDSPVPRIVASPTLDSPPKAVLPPAGYASSLPRS